MKFRIMAGAFWLAVLLAAGGAVLLGNGEWQRLILPAIALFASVGLLYRAPVAYFLAVLFTILLIVGVPLGVAGLSLPWPLAIAFIGLSFGLHFLALKETLHGPALPAGNLGSIGRGP